VTEQRPYLLQIEIRIAPFLVLMGDQINIGLAPDDDRSAKSGLKTELASFSSRMSKVGSKVGHGTWDMGHGTWDMRHGVVKWGLKWDMGHGTWDMGHGTWDMGPGVLKWVLKWDLKWGLRHGGLK
jgi:hypothetical protein